MMILIDSRKLLLQVTIIGWGLCLTNQPSFAQSKQSVIPLANAQHVALVNQQQKVDKLLQLIQQRLLVAHDVARWKWNHKRPIEDRQREQELIDQLRKQAIDYNLQPDAVSTFFAAQIAAGKLIQTTDFQNWQRQGVKSFTSVPDLNQKLRPFLDKLNTEFLTVLTDINPVLSCSQVQKLIESRAQIIIRGDGINPTVRRTAIAPLLAVKDTKCQSINKKAPGT